MKFSLCYTSRRAQAIAQIVQLWLSRAADAAQVEVILGLDADYAEGWALAPQLEKQGVRVVKNEGPNTCVAGWNAAAPHATGDVLIAITDDFLPPDRWDEALRDVAGGAPWWEGDHVVWVSDGYNPDIFTLSILSRRRYQRFGYIFYPGYASLFCDTEYSAVAKLETGSVIDARHLLFEHLHPDCGKRVRDPLDLVHASRERWKQGEMLFHLRRDMGFPIDQGPVAERLETIYQDPKFAVYVQAIRDDFCLAEVIERLLDDANGGSKTAGPITSVWICAPDEYWGGKPQTSAELGELEGIERYLAFKYQQVSFRLLRQPVAPHRINNRSRIMVETAVRNAAIDQIRASGTELIVIADGDELWQPGLFQRLVTFVQEYRPHSVFTGMTPVAGLPGYPIEGATDKATIYIGPGAWFVDCRGVSGHRHELVSHDVIHFTATRRTREEIAQKMLESGHADDPAYDFKTWNEKVLPNIRPGFVHRFSPTSVGLHMYLQYNVWPHCREWRPEEWATLPVSVRQYLALPPGI